MAKGTIYFFCPDLPHVLGGVRQTYRHVDVLNAAGWDAWVVHRKKGFKIKWFEHETRVMYEPVAMRKSVDVAVYPEIWGRNISKWGKNIRKVIFNQNCFYTSKEFDLSERPELTYLDPKMIAAIVVSEDSRRYLEYAFGGLQLHRIFYSVNPKLYYPQKKKRQICLMPRKKFEDVKQVLHILSAGKALEGWKVALIDRMSEAEAAAVMRESAVFFSFAGPEGFGLPGAEAMACKTIAVGYSGGGGDEYWQHGFAIATGDIIGFVKTARRVLEQYEKNSNAFEEKTTKAAEFIAENYSPERERESIVSAWEKILQR